MPELIASLHSMNWLQVDDGQTAAKRPRCGGGGVANQPTCKASEKAAPSRIDYIFVSEALLPAIRGFQVDTCDTYPTHQPLQLLLEVGAMAVRSDRFRKPKSFAQAFDRKVEEICSEATESVNECEVRKTKLNTYM